MEVRWQGGVRIEGFPLGLDLHRAGALGFVSHAHADHFARHEEIWCSEATGALVRERFGLGKRRPSRLVELAFGETRELDGWQVTLHPAGHTLGSAMIHLRAPDGETLLYTGDYKTRPGLSCETCEPVRADILVMETTFGLPRYVLPPSGEVLDRIRAFALEALDAGATPILLGYSFGKAQELLCALADLEPPIMVHRTIARMNEVYRTLRPGFPDGFEDLDPGAIDGHIIVTPPTAGRTELLEALPGCRLAMMSGWGLDSSARYRYGVDEVFPLSDHADHPDSLAFVEKVDPGLVYTLHGYSREFAADLRARGRSAWSIHGNDQMELFSADEVLGA